MRRRTLNKLVVISALPVGSLAIGATPGFTDDEIRIGNIMPYSGPASAYGQIGKAETAYFEFVNDQGGINGRKIRFISYDDGYNPSKTLAQARRLVERDDVLLIFQPLGTAPNVSIRRYMNEKGVPQLFVSTGASIFNDPKAYPWTMGWQPSFFGEMETYARHLIDKFPDTKIAVLYQNDDMGNDFFSGFKSGMGDHYGKMVVAEANYEVTDPTIKSQLLKLKASGARTFIDLTTTKFTIQAIKEVAAIGWQLEHHYIVSPSGSVGGVLSPAGIENSIGVESAFFLKDPNDPQWANDAGYKDWLKWMEKYMPGADLSNNFNVWGYSAAQSLVKVLEACGNNLSRENVMKQASNMDHTLPMLLPGLRVHSTPEDYTPIKWGYLGKFTGKSWELIGKM